MGGHLSRAIVTLTGSRHEHAKRFRGGQVGRITGTRVGWGARRERDGERERVGEVEPEREMQRRS